MNVADVLVCKVNEWVDLQKKCSTKLKNLADELEEAVKAANVTKVVGSSVSVGGAAAMTEALLTGGAALPVMAAVGAVASGTSVGSDVYSANKSKDIMEEAQKVLEELQNLEEEIKNLFESLNQQASIFHHLSGSAAGGDDVDDDDDDDGNIMECFMRSMAKQLGLHLPGIIFTAAVDLQPINMFNRLYANDIVVAACLTILKRALLLTAKEGGKKAAGKAAGNMAGGAVDPELVSDFQNLDIETEASQTLRENANTLLSSAKETEQKLQKIREALNKLVRIKFIIQKENMTRDEKRELIDYAINKTPYQEVKQWLRENAESDVFFQLVNLGNFIAEKLNEEAERRMKKRTKIQLVFLAHGSIENEMIPARFMMPLPSIIDVKLYSPWNCLLSAKAAYSIAKGSIKPDHRQFGCTNPEICPLSSPAHTPFNRPRHWNSMRDIRFPSVPIIMVSPVATRGDPPFAAFTPIAANRCLVPYLAPGIDKVPFFVVMMAISLVLPLYGYEATVHLAASLGKSPEDAEMEEDNLRWQYAYAIDHTRMTVREGTIRDRNETWYNMFRAVFGDESPTP